jgi:hypothetical protein
MGISPTAKLWVYSSQTLTKPSGITDLLVGHVSHGVSVGTLGHLTFIGLLACFVKPPGCVNDKYVGTKTYHLSLNY